MLGALHAMHYVADGVAALDKYDPDWFKKVQELEALDVTDSTNCVITAVLGGSFYMGVNLINGYDECDPWVMTPEAVAWARSHGFDAHAEDADLLNSLWKSKIAALQRRAVTPLR